MGARYLIRFDDICPTMDWAAWDAIEPLLRHHRVRPLLAVVPENRDPKLVVDAPRADFWDRVRDWQAAGWTIALHGYEHRYLSQDAGLLGLNARSEFAGLGADAQRAKLRAALAVFARERVRADAWIAPAHAFDATTVALLREAGVRTISDGFSPWPGTDAGGSLWVPQQLWQLRAMPFGVWTACYHLNGWRAPQIARFGQALARFGPRISALDDIVAQWGERRLGAVDALAQRGWLAAVRARRAFAGWRAARRSAHAR